MTVKFALETAKLSRFWRLLASAFAERFDRSPLDDVPSTTRFVRTRAAYIAQTSLYGYLKTRMGTSFRRHFEDEAFSKVIRASAVKLYVACLADLTIFAVATAAQDSDLHPEDCAALAQRCFEDALAEGIGETDWLSLPDDAWRRFEERATATAWPNAAVGETAFAGSVDEIIRVAPVVDEFKAADERIVRNSIRFRWRDVREQLRKRIDGAALAKDWRCGATAQK